LTTPTFSKPHALSFRLWSRHTKTLIALALVCIVAVLLGRVLFGETVTPFIIAGVLLTLYGVYLVTKGSMKTAGKRF